MLQLSMKCWYSAFNAQGSRLVVVQLGAVKIYVAAVEALRKKERQEDETQFTTKIDGFLSFNLPPWMLMYFYNAYLIHVGNNYMKTFFKLVTNYIIIISRISKEIPTWNWYSCTSGDCSFI